MKFYYIDTQPPEIKPCKDRSEYKNSEYGRIIDIEGIAIAQQRPRTRVVGIDRNGKPTGGKIYAQIYTVNSKHKKKLQQIIPTAEIFEEPTFFYTLALYKPPKSWSGPKTERAYGQRKITKPDGTNILKFYEDLLEGHFMPKDQMINPTMCERYYAPVDKVVICTIPTRLVSWNVPRMIKQYFLGSLTLK